ncbi:MAG TPA: DUF1549 domain-containing protein [Thermoanaerobaculia bacterium]|nr:DUF1549 domain-containing protein [Thermoanaerobaculia bacterium]
MKHSLLALALVAPALLMADEKPAAVCPRPLEMISPRQEQAALVHSLSVAAEAVAERRRASVPPGGAASPGAFPPAVNFIDTDLFAAMKKDNVAPTQLTSDTEFLRRVTLDLTGQIPDTATVQSFLADTSANKRAKMIDQLLASDAFVDRWTMWFGDLVQNVSTSSNTREFPGGRNAYYQSIHDSIKSGKAYDQMVRELISGTGDSYSVGQANFIVRQLQPNGPPQDAYDNMASSSGAQFLGMPLLCLSCHNGLGHLDLVNTYLKSHTRYDFWGHSAFFSKVRAQRQSADPNNKNILKYMVSDAPNGAYQLNTNSGNKTPRTPFNGESTVPPLFFLTGEGPRPGEAWRDAYGRILTANPQFARATANYLWKEMFGLGIVEPTNNIDLNRLDPNNLASGQTLQPTNAQLLTDLMNEFIADKYDLRAILRTIANSSSYQLSTVYTPGAWNEQWTTYFARHLPHRMMAEETLDAIAKATNVPITYTVTSLGTVNSAMKLPDTTEPRNNAYGRFLDEFGRGNRDDQARSNDSSIAQALSLMNDNTIVVSRVHKATANSTVAKTLASTTDPGTIVDQIYLATLSRKPTSSERAQAIAYLNGSNLQQRTEDLQWTLLNSLEFLFD